MKRLLLPFMIPEFGSQQFQPLQLKLLPLFWSYVQSIYQFRVYYSLQVPATLVSGILGERVVVDIVRYRIWRNQGVGGSCFGQVPASLLRGIYCHYWRQFSTECHAWKGPFLEADKLSSMCSSQLVKLILLVVINKWQFWNAGPGFNSLYL